MYKYEYKKRSSNTELSNDFSFTREFINEILNTNFKDGTYDFLNYANGYTDYDTKKSYVWSALSAVSDNIGEILYLNVLNYIDNVSDIDTCNINALLSMVDMYGTNYTFLKNIESIPLDILDLLNFFSIRADYLMNNEKISYSTISSLKSQGLLSTCANDVINSYYDKAHEAHHKFIIENKDNSALKNVISAELSAAPYIDKTILEKIEFNAFYDVLTSNVYKKYSSISSNVIIFEELSNCILYNNFTLPNDLSDLLNSYKVKYNIPQSFNIEAEATNLELNISTLANYTNVEYSLLSIELDRRAKAHYKLDSMSKYSYYDEKTVKEYFYFIEHEYSKLISTYVSADEYQVDKSYIEISSLTEGMPLMEKTSYGVAIHNSMISAVALTLVTATDSIRQTREYLKSHVLRVYMKGTFLLISYAINEYLKNNIYPAVNTVRKQAGIHEPNIEYTTKDNSIELKQYVDLTQYFNIQTDSKYDTIGNEDIESLNSQYWINNGTDASLNNIDNTNIFACADKAKSVIDTTFTMQELADFYLGVLNNRLSTITDSNICQINDHLNNFLSTVFASGADSTFFDKELNKIMCDISFGKFTHTKDIENYLSYLLKVFLLSLYILKYADSTHAISLKSQLELVYQKYINILNDSYFATLNNVKSEFDTEMKNFSIVLAAIESFKDEYDSLYSKYNSLVASNIQYTGPYSEITAEYLELKVTRYKDYAINKFGYIVPTMKAAVIQGITSLENEVNKLRHKFLNYLNTTEIAYDFRLNILSYNDITKELSIQRPICDYKVVSSYIQGFSKLDKFSMIYSSCQSVLPQLQIQQLATINELILNATLHILNHLTAPTLTSFLELSNQVSDYYSKLIDLTLCVNEISSILDYTQLDQYKYKSKLFYKYIGLSVGNSPYYYLDNIRHPSYQIHPCLKNFIEYTDYSYLIESLVGMADENIRYIVDRNIQLSIDNNGYLKNIWNNPLNGNTEYLTKYEKSNHTDNNNLQNPMYGFDGLHYHAALYELNKNPEKIMDYYNALDISETEKTRINSQITTFANTIKDLYSSLSLDIYKYGVDIYENCYILVKYFDEETDNTPEKRANKPGTLWIRYKNHPIAFPAIVLKYDGKKKCFLFDNDYSQITYLSSYSNSIYTQLSCINIINNLYTPIVTDFIFSLDGKQLLLNSVLAPTAAEYKKYEVEFTTNNCYDKATVIVNNVELQYDYDLERYVRLFARPLNLANYEFFKHPGGTYNFNSYYIRYGKVGAIYLDHNCEDDSKTARLAVKLFDYNLQYENIEDYVSAVVSSEIQLSAKLPVCLDCLYDGKINIALFNSEKETELGICKNYLNIQKSYDMFQPFIDTFDKSIVVFTYDVIANTIIQTEVKDYRMYTDIGFIPIYDNALNIIYNTDLSNDLNSDHVLKFLLIGNRSNNSNGIDFKFLYPLRIRESSSTIKLLDNPYHRLDSLSDVKIYDYKDLHYLESEYNKYVLHDSDAVYLDEVENELYIYLSDDVATAAKYAEYYKLANYDVARYLQAFSDEVLENDKDPYIVKPYLLEVKYDDGSAIPTIPTLYLNAEAGELSSSMNTDHFKIHLFEDTTAPEISASWMYNMKTPLTIKLDFNTINYTNGVEGNTRNKYHAFLNLDLPGDSGYLRYNSSDITGSSYTFFIKNVSDDKPKFVLTVVGKTKADPYNNTPIGIYETNRYSLNDVAVILNNGFDNQYIGL